jgi:N-ethylmaleimide reductase
MQDSNPKETFTYAIDALNAFGLAYLHLMEPNEVDISTREVMQNLAPYYRQIYKGTLITNGGYNRIKGDQILSEGNADLVSFGQLFLANPDLPKRLQLNTEFNTPDPKTFYGPDAKGYTDYPFLATPPN